MKLPVPNVRHGVVWALSLGLIGALLSSHAQAQQKFVINNVAEKKLEQLPAGPLFWRLENFPDSRPGAGRCRPDVAGRRSLR